MTATTRVALGSNLERVRFARLLMRAYAVASDTGSAPPLVRPVVSESWRRSVEAGVDRETPAPRMLDAGRTAQRLANHPIAGILPRLSALLREVMLEAGCFAAFSDAEGVLLWNDGPAQALHSAVAPRFLPGFLCAEDRIGTNAIGTALVLNQPVQIFAAEHFNRLLHGWTCAAAPIHDPDSGELLGALDLTGEYRSAHVHGLALVTTVAAAAEAWLNADRRQNDQRLVRRYAERCGPHRRPFSAVVSDSGRVLHADPPTWLGSQVELPDGQSTLRQADGTVIEVEPLDEGYLVWRVRKRRERPARVVITFTRSGHAVVSSSQVRVTLGTRHTEIVTVLAQSPSGLTVRELATAVYESDVPPGTIRAEIRRLRRLLGEDVVLSRPYRLHPRVRAELRNVAAIAPKAREEP